MFWRHVFTSCVTSYVTSYLTSFPGTWILQAFTPGATRWRGQLWDTRVSSPKISKTFPTILVWSSVLFYPLVVFSIQSYLIEPRASWCSPSASCVPIHATRTLVPMKTTKEPFEERGVAWGGIAENVWCGVICIGRGLGPSPRNYLGAALCSMQIDWIFKMWSICDFMPVFLKFALRRPLFVHNCASIQDLGLSINNLLWLIVVDHFNSTKMFLGVTHDIYLRSCKWWSQWPHRITRSLLCLPQAHQPIKATW
jgi:hypothetical protein